MNCKRLTEDQPRILPGRHTTDCPGDCAGCQPCTEQHCQVDGHRHVTDELTCPTCIATVRDNLAEIVDRSGIPMLAEALRKGVNSEAAMLVGPAADPEAFGYRQMSALMGRIEADWLADCRDEHHPLWVLGTYDQLVTQHLNHTRTQRVTIGSAAAYINTNLTDLADDPDFPFDEMHHAFAACATHLRTVLGDSDQGDPANVGCFDCRGDLVRKLTKQGFSDHWTCKRCQRRYTYAEYNFALRATIEEEGA